MSDTVSRSPKAGPPSDISQVLSHGPALCQAYGRFWGTVLLLFALGKTRRGFVSLGAGVVALGALIYRNFF